jgi:hypothetical protein
MLNFPEQWLNRVIALITTLTVAPWLNGIPELETDIIEIGSGATSEINQIHVPLEDFEVDVLVNNTTYPIPAQPFTDDAMVVTLNKFQTKVVTISDDQIMGASYKRIDSATKSHTRSILTEKFKMAIHALAPIKHTTLTPVIETSGATEAGTNRVKMRYQDLINLKRQLDAMQMPVEGRRLVLSSAHYNDMLEDRDRFANLMHNIPAGQLAPKILGFEIYQYDANPYFYKNVSDNNLWTKRPYGAVPQSSDSEVSVCFWKDNVAKKTGLTKQYFVPAVQNPENQTNRLNYRHYFIAVPFRIKYMGAIVSPTASSGN